MYWKFVISVLINNESRYLEENKFRVCLCVFIWKSLEVFLICLIYGKLYVDI